MNVKPDRISEVRFLNFDVSSTIFTVFTVAPCILIQKVLFIYPPDAQLYYSKRVSKFT